MGEKIVNGFLLLLSLFYTVNARQYSFGRPAAPKTGFLPQLIGYCAVAVSAYLFIQSLRGKGDAGNVKLNCDGRRLAGLIGVMAAYILVFKSVGYLLSTVILLFIVMKIGRVKGWKVPAAVSVITSGCFYLIFKVFLSVPLPSGILF